MSNDYYIVACVEINYLDLYNLPKISPDFYHFKLLNCCELCDIGKRFISWNDVYAESLEYKNSEYYKIMKNLKVKPLLKKHKIHFKFKNKLN